MTPDSASPCDLLILGAGWTFSFLESHLSTHPYISYIGTTRDGRNNTLKWMWDSEEEGEGQYEVLPRAKTVLVTFPIKGRGGSKRMVDGYEAVHGEVKWIQLGSTGIFDGGPTLAAKPQTDSPEEEKPPAPRAFAWTDRHSPYAIDNPRAVAEDELLSLRKNAFVLNLSGLWGGTRDPANWVSRIAPSKSALAAKGSLHLIHGLDVARAIVAVHLSVHSPTSSSPLALEMGKTTHLLGERYLLTDLRVYDWWDLAAAWASASSGAVSVDAGEWVLELMEETGVRALPRAPEVLGRAMDSREFWSTFGLRPEVARWERGRL